MSGDPLEQAIIEHHFAVYRTVARYCHARHGSKPGYEWTLAPPGNAYPNFVFNERREAINIVALQGQINARALPPFWLSPDPALEAVIAPAGFRLIQAWQGMAMYPEELIRPPAVPDFEWLKVETPETLDIWTEIVAEQFKGPFEKGYFYPLLGRDTVELFLGRKKGEFVATSLNFYRAGSVGVHMVATRAAHRKQGIGQWAFYHSLRAAFDKGASLAVCSATPAGSSAWQKIGFKVYSKLYLYWLVGKEFA